MFVKPGVNPEAPGERLKVRMPHTFALLADEGQEVPEDMFWLRALRDGDVVPVENEKIGNLGTEGDAQIAGTFAAEPALSATQEQPA